MNSVIVIGRLTKDIELIHTKNRIPVVNFNLAVDKSLSKEKKEEYQNSNRPTTDFIPMRAFGKNAELMKNYLAKGSKIAVLGSIDVSHYKDKSGNNKTFICVLVGKVEFIESKTIKEKEQADADLDAMLEEMTTDYEMLECENMPF